MGGIKRFLVLEAMAERLKVDGDTRNRLEEAEAYIRFLHAEMGILPAEADTGTIVPNNYRNRIADS